MTAKTETPRSTSEDIRMVLRLAELAVFDPRLKQTLREASEEIAKMDSENAALRERLERAEKDDAGNVSTEGNGKVSVSVKNIVQSSKVQRQVEAVKEIALDSPDDCVRVPRAVLECFKRSHYYCPDSWYTCPKHPDGCCNDDAGEECNCGVEQWNAQIEVLLAAAPGEGKR